MSGTGASLRLSGHGFVAPSFNTDLQTTPSGTWTDTPVEVTLPGPGIYHLDASVRAAITGVSVVNAWVSARLRDVTNGVVLPGSEVIVNQIYDAPVAGTTHSPNVTGPIQVEYTAPGPAVIRIQGARFNSTGATTAALILGGPTAQTTLRFQRVA